MLNLLITVTMYYVSLILFYMYIKSTHVYFFPDKSYKMNKLKFEKKKQSIKSK